MTSTSSNVSSNPFGKHIISNFYGASPALIDDLDKVKLALEHAVKISGAVLLDTVCHRFKPHEVTAISLLAESHASVHTYPELGIVMVDAFTCGDVDPARIVNALEESLRPERCDTRVISRDPASMKNNDNTIKEHIAPGLDRIWQIDKTYFRETSPFQEIHIARTRQGVSLFCDGERQSTELTQLAYHEGQIVPAALLTGKIERVLVIGSSEGVVSELAEQMGAVEIVHVDIDKKCVDAYSKYLPYGYSADRLFSIAAGLEKIKIWFGDGIQYVEDTILDENNRFDIISMDLPDEDSDDPNAPQNILYQETFLQKLKTCLTPSGVLITQAGCPSLWRNRSLVKSWKRFGNIFDTKVYFEMPEQD